MIKVCHITSAHPRYDIRIFIKECQTLVKAGLDVSLIVADEFSDEIKDSVKIYSVGKPGSRKERMRETPRKILEKIRELNPDIVHFHDPELMPIGLKLSKQKIKVVYDVHEDLPKQVMSKHWIPALIRPIVSKLVESLEKFCASKFYGVITATPIIENRFKFYNKNVRSICNYPLLSELNLVESQWSNRENKLCYIGSISKTRGIIPVIKSLAISKLILELAGPLSGDVGIEELQSLSGGSYVNYKGVIDRSEITSLLQRVKIGLVTLLPTPSYVESLPIKMFEYMLAGIPVIASNFPLWDTIITKYNCGVLVDPSDDAEIAKASIELLNNEEHAQAMGERGKQAVLEFFNWEQESIKLVEFYRKV